MKLFHKLVILLVPGLLLSCEKEADSVFPEQDCQWPLADASLQHPRQERYQAFLDSLVKAGLPGMLMYAHVPGQADWVGAGGYADLGRRTPMRPCFRSRAGSTVKTFTAATVLRLAEEGRLSLDDRTTDYLPESVLQPIANASQVTIRQLLNHSSGIFDYIDNLHFRTASINDLVKVWRQEELLSYAHGQAAYFAPGTASSYSNTNYVLLGMIIEKVTGRHFSEAFQQYLFTPLGLSRSSFDPRETVPGDIVRGYVDLYSDRTFTESTYFNGWDYYTADGGLIANPYDLGRFMTALFEGAVLKSGSLGEMTQWIPAGRTSSATYIPDTGMGIFRIQTPFGEAYYHSGDAVGYYAYMIYFPKYKATLAWQVNGSYGTVDGLLTDKALLDRIFSVFLRP